MLLDQVTEANCGVLTSRVRRALASALDHRSRPVVLADSRERIGLFKDAILKPNQREAMAALATDGFGRIDVLINNAALYAGLKGARFEHLDEAQWDRVMQVNIKGTWLTSRAIVDHMRGSGGGSTLSAKDVHMAVPKVY